MPCVAGSTSRCTFMEETFRKTMGRSQKNMGGFSQMGFGPQCFSCSGLQKLQDPHRRSVGSDPAQPAGPLRGAEGESRPTHLSVLLQKQLLPQCV